MKLNPLQIGDLIIPVPIIQGGMGVGISLSSLAGAVAKEGAVGVISAAQPGFSNPDFLTNTVETNLKALAYHIKKAKEISNHGIIVKMKRESVSTVVGRGRQDSIIRPVPFEVLVSQKYAKKS